MSQTIRSMGRVWPDGEFVLWSEIAKEISDPEQSTPLGLSKVANSHKALDSASESTRQGLNGITRYGQRMIKSAAYLLQKKFGARQLSFLTCTIPGSPEETMEVAREWSEIVRVFYQKLKRNLVAQGLSPAIVGVTEIQPKRFLRTGGMPLHLHIVFQGAPFDNCWAFPPSEFTRWWKDAVVARVPSQGKHSYSAATNVQQVKKSAAGYLGKYMSKGKDDIRKVIEEAPTVVDALPSCWYNLTAEARTAVKVNTRYGERVGDNLELFMYQETYGCTHFKFWAKGEVKGEDGKVLACFRFGTVLPSSFRVIGLPLTKWDIDGL